MSAIVWGAGELSVKKIHRKKSTLMNLYSTKKTDNGVEEMKFLRVISEILNKQQEILFAKMKYSDAIEEKK